MHICSYSVYYNSTTAENLFPVLHDGNSTVMCAHGHGRMTEAE